MFDLHNYCFSLLITILVNRGKAIYIHLKKMLNNSYRLSSNHLIRNLYLQKISKPKEEAVRVAREIQSTFFDAKRLPEWVYLYLHK